MSVEDNKKIVLGFFENFTAGKPEEALGAMADNATWWVAGNFALSGTVTKQQFAEGLKGMAAALPRGAEINPQGNNCRGRSGGCRGRVLWQACQWQDLPESVPFLD